MNKTLQRVALVVLVCVACIFVLSTLLFVANALPQTWAQTTEYAVVAIVLGVVLLLLCSYLLYVNFANSQKVSLILLACDGLSCTHITRKVLNELVEQCVQKVGGITLKKITLKCADRQNLSLNLKLKATGDVSNTNNLRALLAQEFETKLGLTVTSINFEVVGLDYATLPNKKVIAQTDATTTELQPTTTTAPPPKDALTTEATTDRQTNAENTPQDVHLPTKGCHDLPKGDGQKGKSRRSSGRKKNAKTTVAQSAKSTTPKRKTQTKVATSN